jgi:hypothetical protein
MLCFFYFMVGSWMFGIGWFLGTVYVQHHNERTEEQCIEYEARRVLGVAGAGAD